MLKNRQQLSPLDQEVLKLQTKFLTTANNPKKLLELMRRIEENQDNFSSDDFHYILMLFNIVNNSKK